MKNYQNGKVYRLDCNITGDVYIGSTVEPIIARRLSGHVMGFRSWKKTGKHFMTSFPIIERGNYTISLIEAYPCNSQDELSAREGHFIRTTKCVNKVIPDRTHKEYVKKWYEDNKVKILKKTKENGEQKIKCECGCEIRKDSLSRHRKTQKHIINTPAVQAREDL